MKGTWQRLGELEGTCLEAYLLGSVEFEAALALQRRLAYQVAGDRDRAALLVCEHPPLITVGRHGSWAHLRCDFLELRARKWMVRWVNRGGGCVLHVPGQLAIYPILPLDRLQLGLQDYLERLGLVIRDLLDDFGVAGHWHEPSCDVRIGSRPIAAMGVAVRDWVSYYGLVLNLNPWLEPFRLVRVPGAEPMTSLERERRGPIRPSMVRERLLEHFRRRFGFGRSTLFLEHPALGRKALSRAVTATS